MFKNSIDIKNKHKRFLKEVCESKEVWTLGNDSGYVSSESNHYDDEDENPLLLQVFWSTPKDARVCSRNTWKAEGFELKNIPLSDFIEFWCVGMHNDDIIVGTNFDHQLFGYEITPLDLAIELLELLNIKEENLEFEDFEGNNDLLTLVKKHNFSK